MGLSSLSTPACVRRWGWRRTATAALALTSGAAAIRAVPSRALAVVVLTVPIGIGAGIAGATLPTAVTDLFPTRRATGTAVHALGINVGAAAAAAVAVPVADLVGGWRGALGVYAGSGLCLTALWVFSVRGQPDRARPPKLSLPLGDRRAWSLTTLFSLQGLCYYGLGAWLPDAYEERGWSSGRGGALAAVVTAAAIPASFLIPRAAGRSGSRLSPLLSCSVGLLVGSIGVTEWPAAAWPAALLIGLSLGGLFSLCLLLATDLGQRRSEVAGFAGMMLGLGYVISAAAPIALGAARDAAGSFSTALWLVVAIAGVLLVFIASERRLFAPLGRSPAHDDSSRAEAVADG
jgi:CP family cyanate transporter-like MFS transporter